MTGERDSASRLDYLDFEVQIGLPRAKGTYPVSVRLPADGAGPPAVHLELSFPDALLGGAAAWPAPGAVATAPQRAVGAPAPAPPAPTQAQTLGQALFDALITGDVRDCYAVGRDRARREQKELRLKLDILAPELAALPWEYLFDRSDPDYLCLGNTSIVRYVALERPADPLVVTGPLRILGMVACPPGQPPLQTEREQRLVEEGLRELRAEGLLELTWLEGQTWRDLLDAAGRGPWHVFHFIGHGGLDAAAQEGYIALAGDDGQSSHPLYASELGRLLVQQRSLKLVLLNACRGAQGGAYGRATSLAAHLVRRGIPAVLAMREEITDPAAIELARHFYRALAVGWPVDAALSRARAAISLARRGTVEWATPVLYLQVPDGRLFDVPSASPRIVPGLDVVRDWVQQSPAARDAAAEFRDDLRHARRQIDAIDACKRLHNQLHDLQFGVYDRIRDELKGFPADAAAQDNLACHLIDVSQIVERLEDDAREVPLGAAAAARVGRWNADLRAAYEALDRALGVADARQMRLALKRLHSVLGTYQTWLNRELKDTAKGLDLPKLADALRATRDRAGGPGAAAGSVQRVETAVDALANLDHVLRSLIAAHDGWQDAERELRLLESCFETGRPLGDDPSAFAVPWAFLVELAGPLYGSSAETWALELKKAAARVDAALAAADDAGLEAAFASFRRLAGLRFYLVDKQLMRTCEELREIGATLPPVLRAMQ